MVKETYKIDYATNNNEKTMKTVNSLNIDFQSECLSDDELFEVVETSMTNDTVSQTVVLGAETSADIDQMLFSLTFEMDAQTTLIK